MRTTFGDKTIPILKPLLYWLIFIGIFWTVGYWCRIPTRGFSVSKIRSSLTYSPSWTVNSPSETEQLELKAALGQPYHFLSKGAQCFVFLSEDGLYVIKFFKLHHLQPAYILRNIHLPLFLQPCRLRKFLEKRADLDKTFTSYKIAFQELKKETGLLFLHLNKSDTLRTTLTISDNLGISHQLNLDEIEFFVQKRASLFYPHLQKTINEKSPDVAKKMLSQLVARFVERNQKGIFDKDPDLNTNFGFLDDELIQIDIGRFSMDPQRKDPEIYKTEIQRVTNGFNCWLRVHHPLLSDHLEKEIARIDVY
jgi:hypothetical protein